MSHCPTKGEFEELLKGTLAPAASAALDEHLLECAACRQELNALTGANASWLKGKPAEPITSHPLREVMHDLKREDHAIDAKAKVEGIRLRYLGDYEILQELGRGGMGVVYRARQLSLRRDVAIKVILTGQLASVADVRRFRVEAEAAAKLDHPHIVPIFEIGEHEGHHFFSMKLVEGGSLAERSSEFRVSGFESGAGLDNAELKTRNAKLATLLATIARAVHYAHQRGVLHRDLKPSNILIDREGQSHLTDFGLAKLLEHDSGLTHSAAIMGTPNYLAPEMAAGKAREVTTAADVYSLGAIFYELLTGHPPFKQETVAATLQKVIYDEAVSPRSLNPAVPRDLATICLKCLEKDPVRRYASAELFADELDRFARGEPILARPSTSVERILKWTRRKPALAGSLTAMVLVFVLGFAGVLWKWRGEVHQRRLAQLESRRAQHAITRLEMERAESLLQAGNSSEGLASLSRLLRQQPTNGVVVERLMNALSYRTFCLPIAPLRHGRPMNTVTSAQKPEFAELFPFRNPGSLVTVNFSRDGGRIVTASEDGTARVWNSLNGNPVGEPLRHGAEVLWAQFSADGQRMVTASKDNSARIWDAQTGAPLTPPLLHQASVWFADFSPDGAKVVTASYDKTAQVWDAGSGKPLGQPLLHPNRVYFAAFSPDGVRLLTAVRGDNARLWNVATGVQLATLEHFYFEECSSPGPHFAPDNSQILTFRWHNALLWNMQGTEIANTTDSHRAPSESPRRTGAPLKIATLRHDSFVNPATYSSSGSLIATASGTKARVWDSATGEIITAPFTHGNSIRSVQFSGDGRQLLTGSADGSALLWDVRTGRKLVEPLQHGSVVLLARINNSGDRVVTTSESDVAWLWEIRSPRPMSLVMTSSLPAEFAHFSADGQRVVVVGDNTARLWSVSPGKEISRSLRHASTMLIRDAEFSPDSHRLVTASENRNALVWDVVTGRSLLSLQHSNDVRRAQFSSDGRRILTASDDWTARIWDAESGTLLHELKHAMSLNWAEFSPDGKRVVTVCRDFTTQIWDSLTGLPVGAALRHDDEVYFAQFDPAGERVATACKDKAARIWSASIGAMVVPPLIHSSALRKRHSLNFSPLGKTLATIAGNSAYLWDAQEGTLMTPPLKHAGTVRCVRFSPDSKRALTACDDGTACLWDVATGYRIGEPLRHAAAVTYAEFSHDGTRILTSSVDKSARIWEVVMAPVPAPEWLPEIAEALAGQRLNHQDVSEMVPVETLYRLKEKLTTTRETNYYARWAQWSFAGSGDRPVLR
jgi:eukaryotic-like serine/threonine-protein kinase